MNEAASQALRLTGAMVASMFLLNSCALRPDTPYTDFPEPDRSRITRELHEQPNSNFSRAFRGDTEGLHGVFKRVVDPKVPLTGAAVNGREARHFQFDIIAIRAALGDARFFAALARESREIQRRMKDFAPRK